MLGLSELADRLRLCLLILAAGIASALALAMWSSSNPTTTTAAWLAVGIIATITMLALAQSLTLSTRLAQQTQNIVEAPMQAAWRDDLTECLTRRRFWNSWVNVYVASGANR